MNIRHTVSLAIVAFGLVAAGSAAAAAHAPAGSSISNTASVSFDVGPNPFTQNSNTDSITVDELADLSVTLQSTSPVTVFTPASAQPIRYRVTNLGNGSEQFNLTGNAALGGDQFDPTNVKFYADNGNGIFEPGAGDGATITSVTLAAGAFVDVWFVADIPSGLTDGNLGNVSLTATDSHGTGAAGTSQAGNGDGGVALVFGTSTGTASANAAYQVNNIAVTAAKSSAISDPFGGTTPVPGATITYTITVTTTGSGTATSLVVDDAVPANTTYVGSSITYNGGARTDAGADDNCDFNVTNAGKVHCSIGTVTGATSNTVTFKVTIN